MILIYSVHPLNMRVLDKQCDLLIERLSPFFITDDDFMFTTESNLNLLKELIDHHKFCLFFTESISMMGFSENELSDLITYLLKNKCCFRSEMDNLSFGWDDIDKVGSSLSEIFNNDLVPL
mgnify:CR=1 FL=1